MDMDKVAYIQDDKRLNTIFTQYSISTQTWLDVSKQINKQLKGECGTYTKSPQTQICKCVCTHVFLHVQYVCISPFLQTHLCLCVCVYVCVGIQPQFVFSVKFYPPNPAQLCEDLTR